MHLETSAAQLGEAAERQRRCRRSLLGPRRDERCLTNAAPPADDGRFLKLQQARASPRSIRRRRSGPPFGCATEKAVFGLELKTFDCWPRLKREVQQFGGRRRKPRIQPQATNERRTRILMGD